VGLALEATDGAANEIQIIAKPLQALNLSTEEDGITRLLGENDESEGRPSMSNSAQIQRPDVKAGEGESARSGRAELDTSATRSWLFGEYRLGQTTGQKGPQKSFTT